MSKSIEERVVQMEFENESFEKKASQTKKTLQDLDKTLEFKNGKKSFADVEAAAEKTNFKSLISAADTVAAKLSNLGIVGVTALTNITNRAVDAGTTLLKSLTTDQIVAGWSKFEDKTRSVGTLIAQGYDISTVNDQLERLNWFTDETSYDFVSMTENIAKFTATGRNLTDSVTAMEGIANWAALSGQNASIASRAMYQLSQALGAGYMRLEDYKSIQIVSMDTDEFRQKTLEAAIALGTLQDNLDGTYTSLMSSNTTFTKSQFAQSLTEGMWFTSDVMMKVFSDYSSAVDQIYDYAKEKGITASEAIAELGDNVDSFGLKAFKAAQEARTFGDAIDATKDAVSTGWLKTFELVFGNYEQQRVMWTNLANGMYEVFATGGEERNAMLSVWNELGGRDGLIQGVSNILDAVVERGEKVKEIFRTIFPQTTGERLYEITEKFHELTQSFKMGEKEGQFLENTLGGVLRVLKTLAGTSFNFIKAFSPLVKLVSFFGGEILNLTSSIGSSISKMFSGNSLGKFDSLRTVIESITNVIINAYNAFWRFIHYIDQFIPKIDILASLKAVFDGFGIDVDAALNKASDSIKKFSEYLGSIDENDFKKLADWAKTVSGRITSSFNKVKTNLAPVVDSIGSRLQPIAEFVNDYAIKPIKEFIESIKESERPLDTFIDGIKNVGKYVKNLWENFKNFLKNSKFSEWSESLSEAVQTVREKLKELIDFIKGEKDALSFNDILGAAASVGAIVAVQKISDAFSKIGTLADTIKASFSSFNNIFKAKQLSGFTKNFDAIAKSIAILAGSLALLTLVDQGKLINAAITIGILSVVIVSLSKALGLVSNKIDPKKVEVINALSDVLIKLSTALVVLSGAVWLIAKADILNDVTKVLNAILMLIGMAGVLARLTFLLSKISTKLSIGAMSVIAVSAALFILGAAIKKLVGSFDSLDQNSLDALSNNIVAIILILVGVIAIAAVVSKIKMSSVLGIIGMIGAIILIIATIEALKSFSLSGIKEKWVEILGILTVLIVVITVLSVVSYYVDFDIKSIGALAIGLLATIGSIYLLAKMIEKLSECDNLNLTDAVDVIYQLSIVAAVLLVAIGGASKLSGGNKGFLSLAVALAGVIACVGLLVILTRLCKDMSLSEFGSAIKIIAILAAVAAGLMIAIGGAAKLGGSKGLIYVVGLLGTLLGIGYTLTILQIIPWETLRAVCIAIAAVAIGLGLLMLAFGSAIKTATSNKGSFGVLIGMAVMLGTLGIALSLLAKHDWKQIAAACLGVTVVLLAVTLSLKILSGVVASAGEILAAIGIIIGLGALMIALTYAMSLIKDYNVEDFKSKVLILGAAMGVLAVAIIAIGALFAYVPNIAVGAVVFVAVMGIMSLAILGFASAMQKLDSCDIAKIASDLGLLAGPLAKTGAAGIVMIVGAVGVLLFSVALLALGGASTVCAGGFALLTPALINFLQVIAAIGSALGIGAFENLKTELASLSQSTTQVAEESGQNITAAQAEGIQNGTAEVTSAVDSLAEQTTEAITSGTEEAKTAAVDGANQVVEAATSVIENAAGSEEGGTGGLLTKLIGKIPDDFNIASALNLDSLDFTSALGSFDTTSLTSGLQNMFSTGFSGIDMSTITASFGMDFTNSISSSFAEVDTTAVSTGIQTQLTTAVENVDITTVGETVGNKFTESVASSMTTTDNKYKVEQSGKEIANEANDGAQSVDTTASGAAIVDGIVAGISNNAWKAYQAAQNLAQQCANTINAALQINSPSKLTMKSGSGIVEGLAKGITENVQLALRSAKSAALKTISVMNAALNPEGLNQARIVPVLDMSEVYSQIGDLDLDGEWNPVIRPTLDMTSVNPAMKNIKAIVGAKTERENAQINQNGSDSNSTIWAPTFNQYNNSPKSLSRSEIYRNTKNQFAQFSNMRKGVMA